jgi:hypothetical protein
LAKKAFVYDGTNWIDIAQSTADLSTYQKSNRTGLQLVVPTSATNGTVSANGAVTFSSASSVSINGCFNSSYSNYLIEMDFRASVSMSVNVQMSLLGTPASTAAYSRQRLASYGSTTASNNGTAQTSWNMITGYLESSATIKLYKPALADLTRFQSTSMSYGDEMWSTGGVHALSTSYDGLVLTASTGNISGTIRIYGYNNGA